MAHIFSFSACWRMHCMICMAVLVRVFIKRNTIKMLPQSILSTVYLKTLTTKKNVLFRPCFQEVSLLQMQRECKIFCQKATAWQGEYQIKREIDHPSPFSSLFSPSKKYTHQLLSYFAFLSSVSPCLPC